MPLTVTVRPAGEVASVIGTVAGLKFLVTVVVRPAESVAVSWISR